MSPLRFIHASDFHLDRPMMGITDAPSSMLDDLIDAPYNAAEQIFQSAIEENVEFVLLLGDILNVKLAGPRGLAFLVDQFAKLDDHGIAIHWLDGLSDPLKDWPAAVQLPPNVHRFSTTTSTSNLIIGPKEKPRAQLLLIGQDTDGKPQISGSPQTSAMIPNIGIGYGNWDAEQLNLSGIQYCALGGRHQPQILTTKPSVIHYCGTHQGRGQTETGPHGATLVEITAAQSVKTHRLIVDSIRWHTEEIKLNENVGAEELGKILVRELEKLANEDADRTWLVTWLLTGPSSLGHQLRHGGLAKDLIRQLRSRFDSNSKRIWTVGIESSKSGNIEPSCYEEDTILGEYLRAIRGHQQGHGTPIDLTTSLMPKTLRNELRQLLSQAGESPKKCELQESALQGFDLLNGA